AALRLTATSAMIENLSLTGADPASDRSALPVRINTYRQEQAEFETENTAGWTSAVSVLNPPEKKTTTEETTPESTEGSRTWDRFTKGDVGGALSQVWNDVFAWDSSGDNKIDRTIENMGIAAGRTLRSTGNFL